MSTEKIIARARRMRRIKDGFVLCDNCDTPADSEFSRQVGWTGCAPCITGEADSLDPDRFIGVERP